MPVTHIWIDTSEASKKAWATRRSGGARARAKKEKEQSHAPHPDAPKRKKSKPQQPGQSVAPAKAKPSGTQLKPGAQRTTGPAQYEHLRKTLAAESRESRERASESFRSQGKPGRAARTAKAIGKVAGAKEAGETYELLHRAAGRSPREFTSLVKTIGFQETMKQLWPQIVFTDPLWLSIRDPPGADPGSAHRVEKARRKRELDTTFAKEGAARAAEDLYEMFTNKRGHSRANLNNPAAPKPKPKEETVEEFLKRGGKIQRDSMGRTHIWIGALRTGLGRLLGKPHGGF